MRLRIITTSILILIIGITSLIAQVAISDDPNYNAHPSAVLDLSSNNWGGFVPPHLTTAERNAIINPIAGLMVFDTDSLAYCLFNGIDWKFMVGNTLDKAYDEGPNPGDGRNINAYDGPVEIHSDSIALKIVDDTLIYVLRNLVDIFKKSPGNGVFVHHDHNGNAIEAKNSHSGTGIFALNSGLGPAAKFETTTNLNTEPAVVIINKGSNHALDVTHEDDTGSAGYFETVDTNSVDPTVVIDHDGKSDGIEVIHNGMQGQAGRFKVLKLNNMDPAVTVDNYGQGVGLIAEADSSYGVVGISNSMDSLDAGVNAVGNGVLAPGRPKAAALEIHDGAIRVSGPNQPAGKVNFTLNVNPIFSCPTALDVFCDVICGADECIAFCGINPNPHDHEIGASTVELEIINALVTADSYIQISLQADDPAFAQIIEISPGKFKVIITALGCVTGPLAGYIHYLIVNP